MTSYLNRKYTFNEMMQYADFLEDITEAQRLLKMTNNREVERVLAEFIVNTKKNLMNFLEGAENSLESNDSINSK